MKTPESITLVPIPDEPDFQLEEIQIHGHYIVAVVSQIPFDEDTQ